MYSGINRAELDIIAKDAGYSSYSSYLNSGHWRKFSRNNLSDKCFCCGYKYTLQLHHIDYSRLGKERKSDVVTVCNKCHKRIHNIVRNGKAALDQAHWEILRRVKRTNKTLKKAIRRAKYANRQHKYNELRARLKK